MDVGPGDGMSHSGCAPARGRRAPISVSVDTPDAHARGLVLSPSCLLEGREGGSEERREGGTEGRSKDVVGSFRDVPEPLKGVDLQFPRHLERQVVLSSFYR